MGNPAKCLLSLRENLPGQFKFKEYCPQVYRNLRERFGIEDRDYQVWLWSPTGAAPKSQCSLWMKTEMFIRAFDILQTCSPRSTFALISGLFAFTGHRHSLSRGHICIAKLWCISEHKHKKNISLRQQLCCSRRNDFFKDRQKCLDGCISAAGGALVILSPTGFSSTQSSHQKWRWGVCGAAADVIRPHVGGERNL